MAEVCECQNSLPSWQSANGCLSIDFSKCNGHAFCDETNCNSKDGCECLLPGMDECQGCQSDPSGQKDSFGEAEESLVLSFASMNLTSLPSSIYDTQEAQEMYFDYNDISELSADFCCSFARLTKLSIMGNDLEHLPDAWHHMISLKEIYLNENLLKGLPQSITKLTRLHILSVVGNQISRLPSDVGELVELTTFMAEENKLIALPDSFCLLKNLTIAELGNNCLPTLPWIFGHLRNLQVLNLNANKLTDLPDSFGNLPSLRELDLSENDLQCLPRKFRSAHLLTKFYADANLIQDLPSWIGNMPEIVEFSIKDNKLKDGPLPEPFGTVSQKLCILDMGGNFMLELPETLGCLSSLEYVHFGSVIDEIERRNFQNGNWLYVLPRNFGQLTLLREAHLDENQLHELPDSFGDLINLEWLDLGECIMSYTLHQICKLI